MSAFVDAAIRMAMVNRGDHIREQMDRLLAACKSPIEEMLGAALFATDAATLCFTSTIDTLGMEGGHHGFYVFPQMPVRQYRADFGLIFSHEYGTDRLVVECDGHDFHEKTKEQAAHDKARDRAFLEDGWPVMRFTGSEIYRDPFACAHQASGVLMGRMLASHAKAAEART